MFKDDFAVVIGFIKYGLLSLILCLSGACAKQHREYEDIDVLIKPPVFAHTENTSAKPAVSAFAITPEILKQGLGDRVSLKETDKAALIIHDRFEIAWLIIGMALAELHIEITDRNRDEGLYYLRYNPEIDYARSKTFWGRLNLLFAGENYDEQSYVLALDETNSQTEIVASLVKDADTAFITVNEAHAVVTQDGSEQLLRLLSEALKKGIKIR